MLSMMAQGFFTDNPLLFYPLSALVIFFAVFTFITISVLRTDKESLRAVASLPLVDDAQVHSDLQHGTSHE